VSGATKVMYRTVKRETTRMEQWKTRMVEVDPLRLYFSGRSLFTNTDTPVFQIYFHI
jgi:hypothetical protein